MAVFRPSLFGGDNELRSLTVVGDPASLNDIYEGCVELNGAIFASGRTLLTKFSPALEVLANVRSSGSEQGGLATDGTYLYYVTMGFNGADSWGVRLLKYDQDLNLVAQTGLETAGPNDYPYRLIYSGGYLYHFCGCYGNTSSTYLRAQVTKIDPATLAVLGNRSVICGSKVSFNDGKALPAGGYVASGFYYPSAYYPFLSVFDASLNHSLSAYFSGSSNSRLNACVCDANHIYAAGSHGNSGLILKLDHGLNIVSQVFVGSVETDFRDVAFDKDGNICACGMTKDVSGGSVRDALLVRLAPDLTEIEQLVFGGTGDEDLYKLMTTAEGDLYAFGKETSRNSVSNAMALKPPSSFSDAAISDIAYLSVKASALTVAAGTMSRNTPSVSTTTESWSAWAPGFASPNYVEATIDLGSI